MHMLPFWGESIFSHYGSSTAAGNTSQDNSAFQIEKKEVLFFGKCYDHGDQKRSYNSLFKYDFSQHTGAYPLLRL